jgi:drug/metabolite transporter (DMT)-like permease
VSAFPLRGRVLAAYLTLCLAWGATFLAIRVGVRHLPPALFAGLRFLIAGIVLLALALALRRPLPRRLADWRVATITGLLLLASGNGLVVAGTRFVESGTAAVFVVLGAIWIALFDAIIPGSEARPTVSQFAGLLLGCSGALLLVGADPESLRQADWRGPLLFLGASISWGLGSVYSKRHPVDTSPYILAAIQMLIGGAVLTAIGTALGEWRVFRLSWAGIGSILYLIVFGSIVGYTAFAYLLRHTPPTIAATYVYVNTVVAVLLGWAVLDEPITWRTGVAIGAVLGSVIWVQRGNRPMARTPAGGTPAPAPQPAAPGLPARAPREERP